MEQMAEYLKRDTVEAKQKVIDSVCCSDNVFTSEIESSSLKMKLDQSIKFFNSPAKQLTQDLHLA